jgi:hypothetical protein
MSVKTFLFELKQFFIDSFSSPVYQDGVFYFIIKDLPNPRDSGVFKILCGSTQIALDAATLDESGVVIANRLVHMTAGWKMDKPTMAQYQAKLKDCLIDLKFINVI